SSVRERLRAEARRQGLGQAMESTLKFQGEWQAWAESRKAAVDASRQPQVDAIQEARGNEVFEQMRTADQPISELAEAAVSDSLAQASIELAFDYSLLTTGGLDAIAALALLLIYFVARVLRPVAPLAHVAQELAEG